jgi:hypothetical protein
MWDALGIACKDKVAWRFKGITAIHTVIYYWARLPAVNVVSLLIFVVLTARIFVVPIC